jgi:hypothetical protein
MRKEELALLRDDDLLHLARNPSCNCRADAIRLLVERGSRHASHPEIAVDAANLIHSDPIILKKVDPASAVAAHKLPGLIDVLANEVKSNRALENKSSALEQNLTDTASELKSHLRATAQNLASQHEQTKSALLEQLKQLFETTELYGKRIAESEARLARLERSLWRKFWDWLRNW